MPLEALELRHPFLVLEAGRMVGGRSIRATSLTSGPSVLRSSPLPDVRCETAWQGVRKALGERS